MSVVVLSELEDSMLFVVGVVFGVFVSVVEFVELGEPYTSLLLVLVVLFVVDVLLVDVLLVDVFVVVDELVVLVEVVVVVVGVVLVKFVSPVLSISSLPVGSTEYPTE